jgi:SpoVK/Ycf46/Vps4 family AAA+-type ATPase
MNDQRDFEVIINSRFPLVAVETHEETRLVAMVERVANIRSHALFVWTLTDGLRRRNHADMSAVRGAIPQTQELEDCLRHVYATPQNGIYMLLDVHHYLKEPIVQRLLKSTALEYQKCARTIIIAGHKLELPDDLARMCARFEFSLPDANAIRALIKEEAQRLFAAENMWGKLRGQQEAVDALIQHLVGVPVEDARRLIRQTIQDDGAITMDDLAGLLRAKHKLMGSEGVLSMELETAKFSDVAGLANLKRWLEQRKPAFLGDAAAMGLDTPKGMMLLGVQGGGKSLAAKAVAGAWGVALMRLDFAAVYNKWLGETERNLREALKNAEAMAPCVLWIDEIEKGIATGDGDGGESRRILGTLLTWMAERKSRVFLVATANDIERLPPELVRKGRFDEIFFVDLPDADTRAEIFRLHLGKRKQDAAKFDLAALARAADGFSGAEIEQAIVSGLYESVARKQPLSTEIVAEELARTRPLSVVMAERIAYLRQWASERTVPAG